MWVLSGAELLAGVGSTGGSCWNLVESIRVDESSRVWCDRIGSAWVGLDRMGSDRSNRVGFGWV